MVITIVFIIIIIIFILRKKDSLIKEKKDTAKLVLDKTNLHFWIESKISIRMFLR